MTHLKKGVGVGVAFAVVLTALGGCAWSSGPLVGLAGGRTICVPGEMERYTEVSMPVDIYELPKGTSIQITGIELVDPVNMVLNDDDYRVIRQITDGERMTMPGAGEYPPKDKPFAAIWEKAESAMEISLAASDLPVAVMAHLTPSSAADASLNGFDISYTSDGRSYTTRSLIRLLVPNGPCDSSLE